MTNNPLVNAADDRCTGCGQVFVRSMLDFDALPLVEFVPSHSIPHKRVVECLKMDPPEHGAKKAAPPKR